MCSVSFSHRERNRFKININITNDQSTESFLSEGKAVMRIWEKSVCAIETGILHLISGLHSRHRAAWEVACRKMAGSYSTVVHRLYSTLGWLIYVHRDWQKHNARHASSLMQSTLGNGNSHLRYLVKDRRAFCMHCNSQHIYSHHPSCDLLVHMHSCLQLEQLGWSFFSGPARSNSGN